MRVLGDQQHDMKKYDQLGIFFLVKENKRDYEKVIKNNFPLIVITKFPISKRLINIVLKDYYNVINGTNIIAALNNLKPKTFDWSFIEKDTEKYLLTKYAVTDKADGEGNLLYVLGYCI